MTNLMNLLCVEVIDNSLDVKFGSMFSTSCFHNVGNCDEYKYSTSLVEGFEKDVKLLRIVKKQQSTIVKVTVICQVLLVINNSEN